MPFLNRSALDQAMRRGEMPFLDHLEELRWRLFKALGAVAAMAVVGFFLVRYFNITQLLVEPLREASGSEMVRLVYLSPADPFIVTLKLSALIGLILGSPIVIYQIWAFLSPALEQEERKVIIPSLYLGLILFAAGVWMAYALALPLSLIFFEGFEGEFLESSIEINAYLSMVTRMLVAFGVVFELPVVTMILTALGVATPQFLASKRRHAILLITVLASVLSPGDVIVVTLLMMAPLFLLYELSIVLSKVVYRRRQARRADDDDDSGDDDGDGTLNTIHPPNGSVSR